MWLGSQGLRLRVQAKGNEGFEGMKCEGLYLVSQKKVRHFPADPVPKARRCLKP